MSRFRKYHAAFAVSLQDALAYRSALFSSVLFYTLFLFVFHALWSAIYQGGEVEGMTLTQIIWYLCFTELIVMGGKTQVYTQMSDEIKTGGIAYQLGRPYHYLWYAFSTAVGGMAFGLVVFTVLACVTGYAYVGPIPGFALWQLPPVLLSFALSMALQFFLQMLLGLSAFWIEENFAVYLVYQKLVFMLGTFIPVEFLPNWLQVIARSLPFSYISWAPARLAVGFDWTLFRQIVPLQALWTGVSILACLSVYRLGARKLEVNGG